MPLYMIDIMHSHILSEIWLFVLNKLLSVIKFYYTTVLKSAQKPLKMNTNIPGYLDSWLFVE